MCKAAFALALLGAGAAASAADLGRYTGVGRPAGDFASARHGGSAHAGRVRTGRVVGARAVGERVEAGLAGGQLTSGRAGAGAAHEHDRFGRHDRFDDKRHRNARGGVVVGASVVAPVVVYAVPPPPPSYWYYCASAAAYYPYVQQCPEGWQPVVPQPPAPY
jgi:hypothetical protein